MINNLNAGMAKRESKQKKGESVLEYLTADRLLNPNNTESLTLRAHCREYRLFREKTLPGYTHALSPEDIENIIAHIPPDDLAGICWIAQLQPTRKQMVLNLCWAKYFCEVALGKVTGSMVALYAMNPDHPDRPITWDTSLTPFDTAELEKLRSEGHLITHDSKGYLIKSSLESVRATQHRSLLHEIGHHVDWKRHGSHYTKQSHVEEEKFAEQYVKKIQKDATHDT